MKRNTKIILILAIVLLLLLAWAPWITDDYARNKVMLDSQFIKIHGLGSGQENPEITVGWFPFGRWITTYDASWFVSFYGSVFP